MEVDVVVPTVTLGWPGTRQRKTYAPELIVNFIFPLSITILIKTELKSTIRTVHICM